MSDKELDKMARHPRAHGEGTLPVNAVVEWQDGANPGVTFVGRVLHDYENGTTVSVESVRLTDGSYPTWIGSAHRNRFTRVV